MRNSAITQDPSPQLTGKWPGVLREVEELLTSLRYGSIEITVHDGRVVQIERKEKFRLEKRSDGG